MTYQRIRDYQDDPELAGQLNQLTETIWGITVLDGHPSDYVPFSMQTLDGIVANVCVGCFDVVVNGTEFPANMIQTVLTQENHRRKGLIRQLFTPVQQYIAETTGRTFFTANKDKEQFYAQFGYQCTSLTDYFHWSPKVTGASESRLQKVDYRDSEQRANFEKAVAQRTAVSNVFGFVHKPWLLLWFCRHFLADNIYYSPELKLYLILRFEAGRIDLLDIIGSSIPAWEQLATVLPVSGVSEVRSYFVPDKLDVEAEPVLAEEDLFFFDAAFPVPAQICLPETQRG